MRSVVTRGDVSKRIIAAATASALAATVFATASASANADVPANRQAEFSAAAEEFGVPENVLLAVSYLESRWENHQGAYSTSGGFGPMHLTDIDYVAQVEATLEHNDHHSGDSRGDDRRPMSLTDAVVEEKVPQSKASVQTLDRAAALLGVEESKLRNDAAENIRGGAAILADFQADLGGLSDDPADWYSAVAKYSGATDTQTAMWFADEVFDVLASGMTAGTDDGVVTLEATPVTVDRSVLDAAGLRESSHARTDCPRRLGCEWIPAPYEQYGEGSGDYGNHDIANRPRDMKIDYIIIHDTEGSYDTTLGLVQDPTYVSWQYTLRSADGHIAQHVRPNDVAWQAGNWSVNSHSIGLEHEGYAADGAWYTEVLYRSSAKLVRYLADRFDVPLDRQHLLGHDNVPSTTAAGIKGMHWDPGPYFDWAHYFDLLGAPLKADRGRTNLVTVAPDYETNMPVMYGCDSANPAEVCPERSSSTIFLYSEPSLDSPLLVDVGIRPDGSPSTTHVSDLGSRAGTGATFAVADRQGDWTAVWYLGQKGWIFNPKDAPTLLPTRGQWLTPKHDDIPVYGTVYPEESAYDGTGIEPVIPDVMPYKLSVGEKYAVSDKLPSQYYWAKNYNEMGTVINGDRVYYQIQLGNRMYYVDAADVKVSRR